VAHRAGCQRAARAARGRVPLSRRQGGRGPPANRVARRTGAAPVGDQPPPPSAGLDLPPRGRGPSRPRSLQPGAAATGRAPPSRAAHLSLLGDEPRAVPPWEEAYRPTQDPGVLQEWAGALIRAGRTAEAERLPGVDLASAYAAAEKMAFLRGAFSEAARFGEESFRRRPTPEGAYDVACALARAGDSRKAVEYLERAKELGYSDVDAAATDPDLASLHGLPAFDTWLSSLRKNAAS